MANPSWKIYSSLQRAKPDERAAAKATAFTRLMQRTAGPIVAGVDLGDGVWLPVAQHYGLPTDLIDFTPDSDIAVFFATQGADHGIGVVYFTTLAEAIASDLAILLPPPLFRRIQLQRGVFLRSNGELSKDLFHRIEFPVRHGFEVARNGSYPKLLPEPEWIQLARDFIDQLPASDLAMPGSDLEAKWWASDCRDALVRRPPTFNTDQEFARWIDFFEEMRYWLTAVFSGDKEAFREDLLGVLRAQNRALYALHADFMRALGKPY